MDRILETIKRLGIGRVAMTVTTGVVFLGILIFLFSRVTTSSMVLLYGQIEPKDAGEIISKLDGQGVKYELRGDGTQIYVSPDEAARLRMMFAQDGLPGNGTIGYEIFDRGDSLSTTAFTQDINYIRALEGELVKSISSLSSVSAARVHLVIPKRDPFQREQKVPTASVVVKARNLSKQSIQAIQQLVAASVPGMEASRVAIIDNNGRLLAKSEDSHDSQTINNGINDQRALLEERLSHTVESLIERTVGFGKVRAQASVDLDLDRTVENSELYDPNSQVVRSTQTISDINQEMQSESTPLTVRNAVPTPQGTPAAGDEAQSIQNKSNRNQEIINYEISKTVRQYVKESGEIKRLSVAVMIDGERKVNEEGVSEYKSRSPEEIERITNLVKSAIGFQEKRGDKLEVVNMPFAQESPEEPESYSWLFNFSKGDFFRLIEIVAFIFVGFLLTMNIIRPFIKSFRTMLRTITLAKTPLNPEQGPEEKGVTNESVQLKNVAGLVQSESVESVNSLLQSNPQKAAKVVNSWLNEK